VAVSAAYAHPFEYLFANTSPVSLGPILLGSHPLTLWTWVAYLNFQTLNAHSGYALPGFQSPHFHDFHHEQFNQNFGIFGFVDRIHNTDKLFHSCKVKRSLKNEDFYFK